MPTGNTESETLTLAEAMKKLSESNNTNNLRLSELENKLTELSMYVTEKKNNTELNTIPNETIMNKLTRSEEQWKDLTSDVRNLRTDIEKICEVFAANRTTKVDENPIIDNKASTPHDDHNSMTSDELFNPGRPRQNATTNETHKTRMNEKYTLPTQHAASTIQTIVIPPSSAMPTFKGNISENPHQFLIRLKEYAETVNHWDEQSLLNGISQFLGETALEWYCQLRTSHRRPKTWIDFVSVFINQFNSPLRRARQDQLWKSCKQGENETINEFVVRLRALWKERKPEETEDDLAKHLMCKMKNSLLTMIGVSRCETLDELIYEGQKAEEILYKRSKQQRLDSSMKQESSHDHTTPTASYDDNGHYEIQAMSARQSKQYPSTYTDRQRYTNYPPQTTTNWRGFQPAYSLTCRTCGGKGHTQRYCPNQYNAYQQQHSPRYSKNGDGARAGRDHAAPM